MVPAYYAAGDEEEMVPVNESLYQMYNQDVYLTQYGQDTSEQNAAPEDDAGNESSGHSGGEFR